MKNLGQMMKQAQQVQAKMTEMQAALAELEVEGQAGGGMVKLVLNGKGQARRCQIDPSQFSPEDLGVLEDLVVAAINDAKSKADAQTQAKMSELTGGLGLPADFKLPF